MSLQSQLQRTFTLFRSNFSILAVNQEKDKIHPTKTNRKLAPIIAHHIVAVQQGQRAQLKDCSRSSNSQITFAPALSYARAGPASCRGLQNLTDSRQEKHNYTRYSSRITTSSSLAP